MRSLSSIAGVFAWLTVAGASGQSTTFVLSVDEQGSFFAVEGGAPLRLDESGMSDRVQAVLRENTGTPLIVEAHTGAPVERVRRAAQLLQAAGATRIAFRTMNADQP